MLDSYWREYRYLGIARVTQISWSWLQDYVNQKLACTPRQLKVSEKLPGRLTIECDEMWLFVNSKKNEVYIWLAIDRNSRKIIGCFLGDRTRKSARKLWDSLPEVYQQCDERLYGFLASLSNSYSHQASREQLVKKQV